jgi:hypothetical protein
MSKIKIPCDNGPYRDGKGSLYEGSSSTNGKVSMEINLAKPVQPFCKN